MNIIRYDDNENDDDSDDDGSYNDGVDDGIRHFSVQHTSSPSVQIRAAQSVSAFMQRMHVVVYGLIGDS